MIIFRLFTILLFFTTVLFSSQEELQKVKLQLQWKYQFQFAGFIIAKEKGYYKDAGLDVDILEYHNTNSIKELEEGKVDFAINNSLLVFDDKKLNNVSLVATYFQRSPLILITQPEIKSILGLQNKKIMMSRNNRFNSSLSILFDYFNLNENNVNFMDPSFNINDFIEKKVDAVTAFRSNELYLLDKKNIPYNVIDPVEYGFSTNAINMFVSHDKMKNNPKQIDSFLQASKKGWRYALENIDETVKLIHTKYRPELPIENLTYEAHITKELMLTNLYEIGQINEEFVYKTFEQLVRNGKLNKEQKADKLFFKYENLKNVKKDTIGLSEKEKEWIKNNPVVTYSEVNWKPLSIIENNRMEGIMGDYLDIVEKRTGLKFKFVPSKSWLHVLKQFEEKKIDLVPGVGSSPQEVKLGDITKMYAKYPMVIITDKSFTFLENINDLKGKTIAVPKYYTSYNFIVKNYPHIKLVTTDNIPEALLLVKEKKADAFVGHIATSLYYISELHLKDLKVSGTTKFNFEHHYLIQKDNPTLLSIINKTFDSITYQERKDISSKWIQTTKIEKQIDYTLALIIASFSFIIIALIIFWMAKLKKEVEKRKKSEELLKITNEKLEGLYELSPLGIALTDMEGNYLEFNSAFERICGYSKKELQNLDYWQMTPRKYEQDEHIQLEKLATTGFYGPYEKEYIQKNGNHIPINLNGMLITHTDGKQYVWSIVEDITARKRDEMIIAKQSNLASMGEMIGNIAHQWRQPLSVISTGATGLKIGKEYGTLTDELFDETCEAINDNAQYLSKTIDDFRDFIKGDRKKVNFNLYEDINSFLHLVEGNIKKHHISIELDLNKDINVYGYPNELIQCFINIFNNAKDALDNIEDNKYIFITTALKEHSVIITFRDNAGGIKEDIISHIFEPYFTTKHQSQGTGLGLHMTHNFIENGMNGTIIAQNTTYKFNDKEYRGAEFIITLPLS